MQKYLISNIILSSLLFLTLSCNFQGTNSEGYVPMHHTDDVKPLTIQNTRFENPKTDGRSQIVTYTASLTQWSFLNLDWEDHVLNFPEIDFIFYHYGTDTTVLKEWMIQNDFPFPIFYDYKGDFKKKNIKDKDLKSITFIVKNGSIIDLSNPGKKNFKEILTNLSK